MKKYLLLLLVAIVVTVLLLFYFLSGSKKTVTNKHERTVEVTTSVAKINNIPITIETNGFIAGSKQTIIKSHTSGKIIKINFHGGEFVKKGTMLVSLENTVQKAEYSSAKKIYELATQEYNRMKKLYQTDKAISVQDFETSQNQLASASQNYAVAKKALHDTQIFAPFDGYLTSKNIQLGQYINIGDVIVSLVDKKNIIVDYKIDEKYAHSVNLKQNISVFNNENPTQIFKGKVSYIAPNIDDSTLSLYLKAKLNGDANKDLSPGMSVNIVQVIKPLNKVITIPEESLQENSSGFFVYTIDDNRAVIKTIAISNIENGLVEVKSGIKLGTKIIVNYSNHLSDGVKVKVVKNASA